MRIMNYRQPALTTIFFTKILLFVLVIFSTFSFGQETKPKDVRFYLQQASKAYKEKNYPAYLESWRAVIDLRPGQPTYIYNLAGAYALNGNNNEALASLGKIADM